ncbi:MAG: hypothetical protein WBA25_01395 [Jannaschia sp.]
MDGFSWGTILAGLIGGIIALILKVISEIMLDCYRNRNVRQTETSQREMLRTMLDPAVMKCVKNKSGGVGVEWRTFATLSSAIGADEVTTKRLLIEVGARGSAKDGRMWALKREKPLDPREVERTEESFEEDI